MTTAAQLGEAYAIGGPALELGSVVIDGKAYPDARVRMPLSMLNRHGLVAGATGNDTKESSLGLVVHFADKAGLPLLDLKDLRAVITHLTGPEGKADLEELGGLSTATAGVILREPIGLQDQGGGVFFVTQTPKDVPSEVLAQLGNRVQHALRAFTPDDAKALKATVSTFPESKAYDLKQLLTSMGIGEAAVTILSERGADAGGLDPAAAPGVADGAARPGRMRSSCSPHPCWRSTARPSTASRRTSCCSRRWHRSRPLRPRLTPLRSSQRPVGKHRQRRAPSRRCSAPVSFAAWHAPQRALPVVRSAARCSARLGVGAADGVTAT